MRKMLKADANVDFNTVVWGSPGWRKLVENL